MRILTNSHSLYPKNTSPGTFPCNKAHCQLCPRIYSGGTITGPNQVIHRITGTVSCSSTNTIYVIMCPQCPDALYSGQTSNSLSQRVNGQKTDIKTFLIHKPVSLHFNGVGHSVNDLRVCLLLKKNFQSAMEKETAELFHIQIQHIKRSTLSNVLTIYYMWRMGLQIVENVGHLSGYATDAPHHTKAVPADSSTGWLMLHGFKPRVACMARLQPGREEGSHGMASALAGAHIAQFQPGEASAPAQLQDCPLSKIWKSRSLPRKPFLSIKNNKTLQISPRYEQVD
ncbi:uncharacterized protein LOC142021763 [Carettochelys insculpta]|uniref:uncharacterized protein LOC142021763 n=1 Tax=Carettochelys insculpta TaxID=44489 RepID=UPI003EB7D3BA